MPSGPLNLVVSRASTNSGMSSSVPLVRGVECIIVSEVKWGLGIIETKKREEIQKRCRFWVIVDWLFLTVF